MKKNHWCAQGQVEEKLKSLDLLGDIPTEEIRYQRIGGLTNLNYLLETPRGRFVLRLAGPGTIEYIDRRAEHHNTLAAAAAGVNAEILHFDPNDGSMLSRYVEDSVTMTIERFKDLGAVRRAARAFHQLHTESRPFHGSFQLFEQIDQYLSLLKKLNSPIPEDYQLVKSEARDVREALGRWDLPTCPCHCDPLYENFLDTGGRMYLIDFEYAGNTDPMWDLGDLSVEGEFTAEQDQELLTAYFGHSPNSFDVGRMVMYKALCDLLWTLWGVVQHANNNPADDFWSYSVKRLSRCRDLMLTDDFQVHLAHVRRGP
jgi:thiamine kinase-like enzyme